MRRINIHGPQTTSVELKDKDSRWSEAPVQPSHNAWRRPAHSQARVWGAEEEYAGAAFLNLIRAVKDAVYALKACRRGTTAI